MPSTNIRPSRIDTLRARLFGRAEHWALARRVVAQARPGEAIFCTGEDVGIPVATHLARRTASRRLAIFAHNLYRPRARMALRIFGCLPAVTHWLTNTPVQARLLALLGIPATDIRIVPEQTDTRFFTPAPAPALPVPLTATPPGTPPTATPGAGRRPLIVSVGLEQRDYRTLAEAVATLPVEVRISGFSRDAVATRNAFPDSLPANMQRAFYDWPELRQLYREADLVVVPLFQNPYCAGLTAMLEALACEKPVIISRTDGLSPLLHEPDQAEFCLPVPPRNPAALETAIRYLLQCPSTASRLALVGHEWLHARHTPRQWLAAMQEVLCHEPAAAPA